MSKSPQTATEAAAEVPQGMKPEQIAKTLGTIADSFRQSLRSPILHTPGRAGLGVRGRELPVRGRGAAGRLVHSGPGSDRIIIANHPRWFSRAGLPSHLEPWKSLGAATGNDFEVNFVPDYKILHDAGYHVLAYDLRNFGHSGAANGGVFTVGRFESRDVVGSLNYVRSRPDTKDMTIGLFSRCVGGNSTMFAMTRRPEAFEGVRCMVSPQPLSPASHCHGRWSDSEFPPATSTTWTSSSGCTSASGWRNCHRCRGRRT